MNRPALATTWAAAALLVFAAGARAASADPIGTVTAVQREVSVTHAAQMDVALVSLGGSVLFQDLYQTKDASRLKLLFQDDSILTLGERTNLKITENIYNPAKSQRSTVVDMAQGSVRALVSKVFGGAGSKFEIHSPTAAAAARGTYFIVWTTGEGKSLVTGVLNIGESGRVGVRNIDSAIAGSVDLAQDDYTMIEKGKPPTAVAKADGLLFRKLSRATEIKDQAVRDIPEMALLPGFDVARDPVTLQVLTQAAKGDRGKPAGAVSQETGSSLGGTLLAIPPILQQPNLPPTAGAPPTTPVTVNVTFN
ncbi:MAG: FecR domain-containing protein [Nitrospirae bacterium]|nr:FecR domain-containing protein [Nitrospirota bacterium]